MAEKHSKRQREETLLDTEIEEADTKRHKSYDQILSFLQEEEDEKEPTQHLSTDIFTTLQQELSASNSNSSDPLIITTSLNPDPEPQLHNNNNNKNTLSTSPVLSNEEEDDEDEKERVIRHLLEASDDELGIPSRVQSGDDEIINGGDFSLSLGDGFWEFEDEAANYYTLLQSQLFL